jgi:hypothetical protein
VFILKKNLLQNQQANFNQTWYKSSLGKGNSKLYKLRARSSSKGNNHKNGEESFKIFLRNHKLEELICRFKFVEIMVLRGKEGP